MLQPPAPQAAAAAASRRHGAPDVHPVWRPRIRSRPPTPALPPALAKWVKPAPGKYAKAYASRINDLFGGQRSVGELLFLTEQTELGVCIDAAFDHSDASALSIMRVVEVVSIKRAGARRLPMSSPPPKCRWAMSLLRATPRPLNSRREQGRQGAGAC